MKSVFNRQGRIYFRSLFWVVLCGLMGLSCQSKIKAEAKMEEENRISLPSSKLQPLPGPSSSRVRVGYRFQGQSGENSTSLSKQFRLSHKEIDQCLRYGLMRRQGRPLQLKAHLAVSQSKSAAQVSQLTIEPKSLSLSLPCYQKALENLSFRGVNRSWKGWLLLSTDPKSQGFKHGYELDWKLNPHKKPPKIQY